MRRDGATTFCAFFDEKTEYIDGAVIVKNLPVSVFLIATACYAMRGLTDAITVANYWNANLSAPRAMYPEHELKEISHDTARRIYITEAT